MAVVLPADYYLRNFHELIRFVSQTYGGILLPEEAAFAVDFRALPENAQRLYIRLLCRSRSVFRQSKLKYPEIHALDDAARVLCDRGFAEPDICPDTSELLGLFTRDELLLCFQPALPRTVRRPELVEWLQREFDAEKLQQSLLPGETLLHVRHEAIFAVYRLCFFGNLYQDMTEFVLRDLGLTQYEPYVIDADTRAFNTREQLDAHLCYYRCADYVTELGKTSIEQILKIRSALPGMIDGDHNLKRRIERFTNQLARQLERNEAYVEALSLYRLTERPPSRERQARVLLKLDQPGDALGVCQQILFSPHDEEEREFALLFGARLARKENREWQVPESYCPAQRVLELPQQDSVERAAAEALAADAGAASFCFYTENTLFNAVFGLVFWDIIYAPVAGVFFNPFQSAPADLYEPGFREQRAHLIHDRLAELDSVAALQRRVEACFHARSGIQNVFLAWRFLSWDLLELALLRIPLSHWLVVFERLLADLRSHRSGFPDLILFPAQGGYRLIEVKGPGDKLQKNQLRWMRFFHANGIPHEVAKVIWCDEPANA